MASPIVMQNNGGQQPQPQQWQQQLTSDTMIASLTARGLLGPQFQEIVNLKTSGNPRFVGEMLQLYIKDAGKKIQDIERHFDSESVDEEDQGKLDHVIHQLKGSSATVGAEVVFNYCVAIRQLCQAQDFQQARRLFWQFKQFVPCFFAELHFLAEIELRQSAQVQSSMPTRKVRM